MNDFVLPKKNDLEFDNGRLNLINVADRNPYGGIPWINHRPTHYAVLLGAYRNFYMLDGVDNKALVMKGYKPKHNKNESRYSTIIGKMESSERALSLRPMMKFNEENKVLSRLVFKMKPIRINDTLYYQEDGIGKIEYGYYPNRVVQKDLQKKLFDLYLKNELLLTGNHYTIDEHNIFEYSNSFSPKELPEFEYNGGRYILVDAKLKFGEHKMRFSKVLVNDEEPVWVKVEPITWYASKKDRTIISAIPILSGIPYNYIHDYMNLYFKNEIVQGYLPYNYKDKINEKKKCLSHYLDNIYKEFEELESIPKEDITYEDTIKYEKLIKRLSTYSG